VKSLTRAQVDGAEGKVIAWTGGGNDRKMKGNDYLQQFALPNFFFFVTTAYNILRHRGVPLGKRDFLGPVNFALARLEVAAQEFLHGPNDRRRKHRRGISHGGAIKR
jgi:hypothetical protein